MSQKLKFLLINDDGIEAPGLKYLWHALKDFADLTIIAPATEQSGVGLCVTSRSPLHIEAVSWENQSPAWKVSGTPADCVRMALSVILDHTPDLIVSGINRGSNSGRNVLYSGTVGGVIEGVNRNIPGIAFSTQEYAKPNYNMVAKYICSIVRYVLENPLPKGTFLNVNVPDHQEEVKGFKFARQGLGFWVENPDKRLHPEGRHYYWHGGKWLDHDEHQESDVHFLKQGFLTAVPIHVHELTDLKVFSERKDSFEELFQNSSFKSI